MLRVFVLRHGHSFANEQGRIASRVESARDAYGLTPLGRDQVRRSVRSAASRGFLAPPVLLLSSPLLRSRQSAGVAGEILGVSPRIENRLRERDFGELELGADRRYAEVWEADLSDPTHCRWSVESVADVLRRAAEAVADATREMGDGTLVLCTHGDVASALLCASLGAPLGRHREVGALATGSLRELPSVQGVLAAVGTT